MSVRWTCRSNFLAIWMKGFVLAAPAYVVLFTDFLGDHPNKVWRHRGFRICKVTDLSSVLLSHVSRHCTLWSSPWSHFPAGTFKLYW